MTTWQLDDLVDVPVVSNDAAREIGKVAEVLFDPEANALFGLVLTPTEKDEPALFLPLAGIRTLGKDAITIENADVVRLFEDDALAVQISEAGGHRDGMRVMTESGETIGKVDKVTINEDGTVASYHSTTGFFGTKHDIEPSEVKSSSEDMIIIYDSAREGAVRNVTG